jgi:hypothetical protein
LHPNQTDLMRNFIYKSCPIFLLISFVTAPFHFIAAQKTFKIYGYEGYDSIKCTIEDDNPRHVSHFLYGLELVEMDMNGSAISLKAEPSFIANIGKNLMVRASATATYYNPDWNDIKEISGTSAKRTINAEGHLTYFFAGKKKIKETAITLKHKVRRDLSREIKVREIVYTTLDLPKLKQWGIRGGYLYDQSHGTSEQNLEKLYPWMSSHSVLAGVGFTTKRHFVINSEELGSIGYESMNSFYFDYFYSPSLKTGYMSSEGQKENSFKKGSGFRLIWEIYYKPQRYSFGIKFKALFGGRPTPSEDSKTNYSNIFFGGGMGILFGYKQKK